MCGERPFSASDELTARTDPTLKGSGLYKGPVAILVDAGSASAKDGNVFFHANASQGPRGGTRLSELGPDRLKQA